MIQRLNVIFFYAFLFLVSMTSSSEGFLTNANRENPNDPNDTRQREYTRENAAKPVGQGGYYGGHDTLTTEGMLLKDQVHRRTDVDGGADFRDKMINEALPWLRTGAHDEDQTKYKNKIKDIPLPGYEDPLGPNLDGNYIDHFYNPDDGKGYSLVPGSNSAVRRAMDYNVEIRKKVGCTPGGIGNLSTDDKKKVYDWFGRSNHLIHDMAHPSHTNDSLHIIIPFEDYLDNHWDEIVNSKEFKEKVTVDEYRKGNYSSYSVWQIGSLMHDLAKISKKYATEEQLYDLVPNPDGTVSPQIIQERLMKNVNDLVPEAIKYTAGYIDAIYDFMNNPVQNNPDCDRPADIVGPGGDHPDDRFDVSDEFYWEKEFKLTDADLTELYLRTAVKKGKIGIWYKKQFMEAFFEGRAKYRDAPQTEKDAILTKFQSLKNKLEQRRNQIESDWKGAPDIALFTNGFYNPSISLMLKIGEPVSFQDIDFNPGILKGHPVLLIPTGGFYGLSNSESVKVLLDEYVKNGGILVAFTQQHGADWGLLPTAEDPQTGLKKGVTGYGYQEDQSCQFNSVYIDTYHPILSGFSTSTANIGVDGYFTSYPDNSTILLRRTANGQPAMILYPYGNGYVVATTLYTDFALSHSQANQAEINLVQNIISWAKRPDTLSEVIPGETVSVSLSVANYAETDAASLKLTFLDPGRKVINEQTLSSTLQAGQSVIIPVSYATTLSSTLGIYHIDFTLLNGQGTVIQPQAETDSGRFVISNPPKTAYQPGKSFQIWVTSPTENVLRGTSVTFSIHIKNNTDTDLVGGQIGIGAHEQRSEGGRWWVFREKLMGINVGKGQELDIPWTSQIDISQSIYFGLFKAGEDPNTYFVGGGIARVEKGIRVLYPSARINLPMEKKFYGRGEAIAIDSRIENIIPFSWEANLKIVATDPMNAKVFEDTKTVALSPLSSIPFWDRFTLSPGSVGGSYTVRAVVLDGDRVLSTASGVFELTRSQISVTPTLPSLLNPGANTIPFVLTNTGKVNVSSGILDVNLKDPGGGIIFEGRQFFSLIIRQSVTLYVPMTIPPLKFGTYILTYTQSDESREGMPATVSFSNNCAVAFTFDKPSYRVREAANLVVELKNTGNFSFESVPLTISVPDAGFADTQIISLSQNQSLQLAFSIPIPDTIAAGPHDVNATVTLPSGSILTKSAFLMVPESALVVSYGGSTTLNAGAMVNLRIENKGGKETTYTTEKLLITDSKGTEIYGGNVSGIIAAGEEKDFADIRVPSQAVQGVIFLDIAVKDNQNGKATYFFKTFEITGVTSSLQAWTDKVSYLTTEAITGVSSILNGPMGIEGGSLKVRVTRRVSGGSGTFTHFLPLQGWWPFNRPFGIAIGPDGSIYVADTGNNRVQKFDRNERFVTQWGGAGSGDGQFNAPNGIAVGPDGSVYVAEKNRIQKFTSNGSYLTKWGSFGSGDGQFNSLFGIAVDSNGSVYAADYQNNRIQKFDSDGVFIRKWGSFGGGNGQFYYPIAVAAGSDGSVYVADLWNHRIQKFNDSGEFLMKWGTQGSGDGQFISPWGIAVASDGSVYVSDSNDRIQKFDSNGNFLGKWGSPGSRDGEFADPRGISLGLGGTVYVADLSNSRVQKFDSSGNFIMKWGIIGNGDGEFVTPTGIAIGPDDSIYVADYDNHDVKKFDRNGTFMTKWGSYGSEDGQFDYPVGIVVDSDGSVYVADSGNFRIQKFGSGGNFIRKWGTYCVADKNWDGLPDSDCNGQFYYPMAIAVGPEGSIYVADTYNDRIQKFDPDGNFIAKWGSRGIGDGQFSYPSGIAVGSNGYIYVADELNDRIQIFAPDGTFLVKWGSSGSGDGQFDSPGGIGVGSDGSVLVVDRYNYRIQKFGSNGNFIAKWENSGGEGEKFYSPYGIAVGLNGLVYVTELNGRIQRMTGGEIDQTFIETTLPIDQPANTTQDYLTNIGTLNVRGKVYLEATLANILGQTIAEASYPFYVYDGDTILSFQADKKYYKPGEAVTITGQVENRALIEAVSLSLSLSIKQGNQVSQLLDAGPFNISIGGTQPFSVTTTAGAEGVVTLTGKVTQSGSELVEIIDQYEVAKPAIVVSVTAPEAVRSEAFSIHVQLKNEGKTDGTVNLGVRSEGFGDSQIITVPAGETKFLQYTQETTWDVAYTFTFTGDLEQTITKIVSYGLAASVAMNSEAIYPEGSVAMPLAITNTGPLAGTVEIIFKLFSPPTSPYSFKEDKKSYYLPAGGAITDTLFFILTGGDYQLVATSQAPVVNVQASFSVRRENRVDMTILAGTQEGGLIPVTVNLSNLGYNDLSGSVSVRVSDQTQVVWNSSQSLAQLARQNSQLVTFNIDPSAIQPGDYTLATEFIDNGGQQLGWRNSPVSIKGALFQITQLPTYQTFNPGEEATFTFKVKNSGNQEGGLEFHLKSYDRIDIIRQEWLKAGEEKALDFAFPLPEDLEEKDYFADYEIKGGARGQIKYHLAGINLTVNASLDKPYYNEGESAHLTLSVSTPSSNSQSLFARVNYSGYESQQSFLLNGSQGISFDIPLIKITGGKLFFGIYQESGRSLHLNSLYIYKAGDVLTLETDKQVYKPGERVAIRVSSQQAISGTLTLSAPSYEEAFAFSGNAQKSFVLPSMMTAGTYYISYQLSAASGQQYAGSQPFDVEGIQVKVKEARLDKAKYASSDTMSLNLTVESNQDLGATLKTWIVDPEKNYSSAGRQEIALTRAQPFLAAQSSPLSTIKLGIHRMVYGIYKEEMLLCSGSYAFDVGEAILLGISTDKAEYPQGNEPIIIEAKAYGTVPGNLEFSVDGQTVGSQSVSLSGFSSIQYTLSSATPGVHALKVSLISGGLTSAKQTTFVYGSNLPDLSVWMTSDPNIKDGFITITITVTNKGKSASIPTTLGLYDAEQLLTTFEVKGLQPGESQTFTYRLNVLGRAGANSLLGRIDPGNQVYEFNKGNNESSLAFTVPDLTLRTSLDKSVYAPGETIGITSLITNLSKDPISDLTLTTEVKDVTGLQVFTDTQYSPTIEREATASVQTLWLTDASLKEGVYSISQTIQGKVTARATASVEVKDFAKGLEGTITAQPSPVNQGSEETLSYTVMNKGSVDLSGLMVKAVVVNPDTGVVKKTFEKVIDLPQNATFSGSFSASTADLAPQVYTAILQVSSAVILTPKTLGSVSFEVKPAVPMVSWGKIYGGDRNGVAYAIQQAQDGGYIAAGATSSFFQLNRDAWVWKLGSKGEVQWQKAYGSGGGDAAYAVQATADGGYVVAGETNGILGVGRQCWVWKLDVNGAFQWQKTYGDGWAKSIQQTLEGGYIVAGARDDHAWVMKLDGKGEILWQKAYGRHGDEAYSVQQTVEGGYIVAGKTGSEGSQAAWLGKLDARGEIQWQKVYGSGHGEAAYSIRQTIEGGYIMAGVTNSLANGDYDAWVLKLDAHGIVEWQKAYGGQKTDAAYSIQQTTDDGYIVAGVTNSFGNGDYDAWVLKLGAGGELHWQKAYGAQQGDAAFAIEQAKDGGYIVAGGTNSFGDRDYDVWLWKVDEEGSIPACQGGWMKNTDGLARETQALAQDTHMAGQDTHVLPKEGNAWVKEMQGWEIDVCAGIPDISVAPSSHLLPFLLVKVGKSSTKTIAVSNKGTGDLEIGSIKITGAAFSQKNDCTVLSPGHSCTIAVTFKPTAPGLRTGILEIYSNDPDESIVRIGLSGTGY